MDLCFSVNRKEGFFHEEEKNPAEAVLYSSIAINLEFKRWV